MSETNKKNTGDKSGDPQGVLAMTRKHLTWTKNLRSNPQEWIPQECKDTDTAENPAQANTQGVGKQKEHQ